jgi:diacylglycerol kinase family enzyme
MGFFATRPRWTRRAGFSDPSTCAGPADRDLVTNRRIPAFVNPGAGAGDIAAQILAPDDRFDLRPTHPDELDEAVREEVAVGTRRILVAGGDGTVATAAGAVARSGVELALLPSGTLNHFARDRGIPVDLRAALTLAADGRGRPVDAGYLNDRLFLNTGSIGIYADLARHRDRYRPRLGYALGLAFSMALVFVRMRSVRAEVRLGSEVRLYRTSLLYFGVDERDLSLSGFGRRAPDGRRGLHMIAMRGKARRRLLAIAAATAVRGIGSVAHSPRVDSELEEEYLVEVEGGPVSVALDGEVDTFASPLRWRLERDALMVVAPPEMARG